MCGATEVEPLTTREAVARETPARCATFSSVGLSRPDITIVPSPISVCRTIMTEAQQYVVRKKGRAMEHVAPPPVAPSHRLHPDHDFAGQARPVTRAAVRPESALKTRFRVAHD